MGVYVYAIGRVDEGEMPPLAGVLGESVFLVASGALAAVASECPVGTLRPERKHIAASQRVLNGLGARFDLLPVAFGMVATSRNAVRRFISEHGELLSAQLDRVAGKVEMDLRLNLGLPDPIGFLVEATPTLKAARDRAFGRRGGPSYDERIRLGQLCGEALRAYRAAQTAGLVAMLGSLCAEIATLPVGDEQEVAHLAMLVPRDGAARFESAVDAAAARLPEELVVTIGGPYPPHNFVQLGL